MAAGERVPVAIAVTMDDGNSPVVVPTAVIATIMMAVAVLDHDFLNGVGAGRRRHRQSNSDCRKSGKGDDNLAHDVLLHKNPATRPVSQTTRKRAVGSHLLG